MALVVEGKLLAEGEATRPIRIEREGATAWASIQAREGAELRLAHATLEGGGNSSAMVENLAIVSADEIFPRYAPRVIWA